MNKMLILAGLLVLGSSSCGGDDSSNQTFNPVVTGSSCAQDADCKSGQVCGYATADSCSATGVCLIYPIPGTAHCNSVLLACGCSGSQVAIACDFPSGYAPAPIRSGSSSLSCP
jgi:hypothetical protein